MAGARVTYKLGDLATVRELKALGFGPLPRTVRMWGESSRDGRYVRAEYTGEKRPPRAGEWYLSGAIPTAYRAPSDLSSTYMILRLVAMERRTVETVVQR